MREWQLEEFRDPDSGAKLLLDPDTNVAYIMGRDEKWPMPVGG